MKKMIPFLLCALMTLLPLSATAESLPEVLEAVSQGLSEGLKEGAQALAAPDQDLSLTLRAEDARLEEGRTTTLTLVTGNPYPTAKDVTFTLALPGRLSCAQPLTWQAQLEAAKTDPATGELVPSVALFTREVTLTPNSGDSEQVELCAEMGMGARFYRAKTTLELCVPRISARAVLGGTDDGRIGPGEAFSLDIDVANDGAAPKDVALALQLPDGVSAAKTLPDGFSLKHRTLSGTVRAEAGGSVSVSLPLETDENALADDEDASRMIGGVLTADGARIDTPVLHIVAPLVSAKLTPQKPTLEEGQTMDLAITLVNAGLAEADVELSCLLPQGLSVVENAAGHEQDDALRPTKREQDGALIYAVHMDAAAQTDSGVAAAAKEIRLRVRANAPIEDADDRLLGASLAWRIDGGDTQLSEAAALRVSGPGFMGLSQSEWNGILLAALLMMVTVCCLYSAVKSDNKTEDYCFE